MQALKTLIEQHEDWLTDRVIHYAQQKNFTQFSSTLREAWRISICGLSKPLTMFLDTAQDDTIPKQVALKAATEFGITQGIQHRARGIDLTDFLGLLKLYRNAYLDLASDKATDKEKAHCLQILIVEQFDAIELGLLEAWTKTETSDRHQELQAHNRALTNEKNKYLTVFESIAEPAILLGPDQEPTHVNSAANRLLLGAHEPGAGYYGAQVSPRLASIIDTLLETADRPAAPITLDTPNGARSFEVSVQKMLDISQKFAGSVIILQDITAYQAAIQAAQDADRANYVFLDTVSHEIRTPINSILGLAGLLDEEDLPQTTLKRLRRIRTSGEMLSALIENVLGLSRAETNALQLVEQNFDLTELCAGLCQVLDLNAKQRPVLLQTHISPNVPTHLHGDWHKLRHVLMNLLSNALKFTKQGTVTLHVSRMADKADTQAHLLFEVIDTGCGISETAEDTLFDPFVQTGAPASAVPAGGSGLGLAISLHLVDFLGGHISYSPNPNGGSIFSFDLTFDVTQKPALFPENATGHHILVVEDDPVNAIVIEGYLTELGNTVTQVDTYDDAVAALETEQIEIVVTDFKLGTHTGLDVEEAASRIAQNRGIDIPVLLVTAAIPMDAVQRLNHRDTASVLQKPFSRNELATALSTICKHALSHKAHVPKRKTPALSRKDLNRLLSDLGFERCDSVVRSFQTNLPSMISGMQAKLNKQDITGLRELLHRLVSASGFVGGKHLVEMTVSLSQACKQQDHATIQTRFDDLKSEGAALLAELEDWRQTTLATR